MRFTSAPPNPPKTLADLRERRSNGKPPPLLHWRFLRCNRLPPAVAALERISINEPEMAAGSSSSAGGDGLSLLSHCVPSYTVYAIELETFALDAKKRKKFYSIYALCRS